MCLGVCCYTIYVLGACAARIQNSTHAHAGACVSCLSMYTRGHQCIRAHSTDTCMRTHTHTRVHRKASTDGCIKHACAHRQPTFVHSGAPRRQIMPARAHTQVDAHVHALTHQQSRVRTKNKTRTAAHTLASTYMQPHTQAHACTQAHMHSFRPRRPISL